MKTGCMRSTLEPEHRQMTKENKHYQEMLESLQMGIDEKQERASCAENPVEGHLKKPRRKDTPVLNSPPHIPGARMLKVQKQMVHTEDEEKDMKD